ncbi:MAG: hypothetical protein J0M12_16080 [Deltaproteobacteria bacterium]|nr:hypothetical protein [Deltaproteobacteria bacterium]
MKLTSRLTLLLATAAFGVLSLPHLAGATPSSHVWTPSTDIQSPDTFHLTYDTYIPSQSDASGSKPDTVTDLGLEAGVWPLKDKLGIEFGFDNITGYGALDDYPLYFNAKLGTPENTLFTGSPALAFGGYNFGTKHNKTNQNIYYVESAKTFDIQGFELGRLSFGWFWGNQHLLLDEDQNSSANGAIIAWERTVPEISDRLWVCVDYQGSQSGMGALAPGASWKITDKTSLLFGYVIPNNTDLAQSFTVQLDVDFSYH